MTIIFRIFDVVGSILPVVDDNLLHIEIWN